MRGLFREIFSWLKYFIAAIAIGLILNATVVASAVVISSSMENTIMTDGRVMGLRLSYVFSDPERFEVILFDPPDDAESLPFVKRIIGLPGETVLIIDGRVYIDGSTTPLSEPYLAETPVGSFGPVVVPAESFFVMGDNRNRSNDSRHWENTFVPRDSIIGRLFFQFFPSFNYFG